MHAHLREYPAVVQAIEALQSLSVDQFEIYVEHTKKLGIEVRNQKIDSITRAEDLGIAVRVLKDRRLGFSFSTSLEHSAIQSMCAAAVEISRFAHDEPTLELPSYGAHLYADVDTHDSKGLARPLQEKLELTLTLERLTRAQDSRIQLLRKATYSELDSQIILVDSSGESLRFQSTLFHVAAIPKAESEGDAQMGWHSMHSNDFEGLNLAETARRAALSATELLGAKACSTLRCPAILRADAVLELIDFLSSSFSAEKIHKQQSLLGGKQGERIVSEQITLIQDGLLPGGARTAPFDGEGIPARRLTLLESGFFQNAIYDCAMARKLGAEPSGSAVRSLKTPPVIGISNLTLQNGKKSFAQLLEGIDRGVVVTQLQGLHTANEVTGDFSLGASGFWVERGRISHPIKGFAVAGNILDLLRKVTDVGNDTDISGHLRAPSLRVSELSVGGQ